MYFADRVKDTTGTAGTGSFTLNNATLTGYQSFATKFSGQVVRVSYCRVSAAGLWEVGKGTFNGTSTLTRDVVRDGSSGPGVLVTFTSSADDIFITASAEHLDNCNIGMQYAQARGMMMP
jgi:hypothetical protein